MFVWGFRMPTGRPDNVNRDQTERCHFLRSQPPGPTGTEASSGGAATHLLLFWWQPTLKRNHTHIAELYNVGERKITRRSLDSATDVAMNHFMRRSFNLRCQVTDTQTQWRQRISASHGGEKNHSPASINPNYTDHHVSIVPLRPLCICK